MAKQVTFKVSKRNGASADMTWDQPESLQDPRWNEVVSNPGEDINELAVQSLIIKIQGAARDELQENGAQAAQKVVNEYKYGSRSGGFRRPTVTQATIKEVKFSKAQLEALKAAGVKIETEEEAAAA